MSGLPARSAVTRGANPHLVSPDPVAVLATAGFGQPEGEEEDPAHHLGRSAATESPPGSPFVAASLVSRGIIIVDGMPVVPIDDVAAALGARIVDQRGGPAFRKMQGARSILSF